MVKVVTMESNAQARRLPRMTRSVPIRAARERAVPRLFAAAARLVAVEISATFGMVSAEGIGRPMCQERGVARPTVKGAGANHL